MVYDLGGGTFDVAVLRKLREGFEQVGQAAGLERLGGVDFDEALYQHVLGQLPADGVEAARSHPDARQALAQFRRSCVEAKEALSTEDAVDVPVVLPGLAATVRVTRVDFEDMIRPVVRQSVALVRAVLTKAKIPDEGVKDVLLVGGSSRIPLVEKLIRLGARAPHAHRCPPQARRRTRRRPLGRLGPAARTRDDTAGAPSPSTPPTEGRRRLPLVVGGAIVLALALGGGIFALTRSSDDDAAPSASSPATVTTGVLDTDRVVMPPAAGLVDAAGLLDAAGHQRHPGHDGRRDRPRIRTDDVGRAGRIRASPSLPAGAQWIDVERLGIQFAAPADWIEVDPDPDVPLDEAALAALSAQSGVPVDALRQTVGRQPEPYVFKPPTPGGPYPNINVSRALMSGVPTPPNLAATIRDLVGPDASITSGSNPGGSTWVQYSLRPPNAPIQGYAQAFPVPGGAVLITVKTLDTTESVTLGQLIDATFSSRRERRCVVGREGFEPP